MTTIPTRAAKRTMVAWALVFGGLASLGGLGGMQTALAAATVSPATPAPRDDLGALMRRLRAMPGLHARFTETKTIGLLAVPLVNEGTLDFDPPGRLVRTIDTPRPSRVLLVGDDIWVREDGKNEHIDLTAHPAARSLVGSFRSFLAGDRHELDRNFDLRLRTKGGEGWVLVLRPRTKAMARMVSKMTITGHREIVERLVVEEASGDVSDTRFRGVDPRRTYTDDEADRLFTPPG